MELNNLVMTCMACPSQWEANLADGRGVYIRYRHGWFEVWVSKSSGKHGLDGNVVYGKAIGEELDGVLDEAEMLKIVAKVEE